MTLAGAAPIGGRTAITDLFAGMPIASPKWTHSPSRSVATTRRFSSSLAAARAPEIIDSMTFK